MTFPSSVSTFQRPVTGVARNNPPTEVTSFSTLMNIVESVEGMLVGPTHYNVKDPQFGAKGDDATDDTAALQAAIYAQQDNGGVVYLPPGIYRVSSQLLPAPTTGNATRPCVIVGAGFGSVIKQTVTLPFTGIIGYGLASHTPTNPQVAQLVMRDLTLDGNYSGVDSGALPQDSSPDISALISLPYPYTSASASGPNGFYHHLQRVRFYRPIGYGIQPAQGVKLEDCVFDGCGQPLEFTTHYDNIGGGDHADAIVIGCDWRESSGNFVDFEMRNSTAPGRVHFIGNVSRQHVLGGIFGAGDRSIIAFNRMQNTSTIGGGVGYDSGTTNANRGGNVVVGNHFTNMTVKASGLTTLLTDLLYGNLATDVTTQGMDVATRITVRDGVNFGSPVHGTIPPSVHGDGVNAYLTASTGSCILRPAGNSNNGSIFIDNQAGGGARLQFASTDGTQDVDLFRSTSNTLKTNDKFVAMAGLGVGNSSAASAVSGVARVTQVFDSAGSLLGYLPIYSTFS